MVTLTSILARLGNAFIVMALVALLTFLLIDVTPGNYLEDLKKQGDDNGSPG